MNRELIHLSLIFFFSLKSFIEWRGTCHNISPTMSDEINPGLWLSSPSNRNNDAKTLVISTICNYTTVISETRKYYIYDYAILSLSKIMKIIFKSLVLLGNTNLVSGKCLWLQCNPMLGLFYPLKLKSSRESKPTTR